jgi:hypothetical protein
MHSGGGDRFAVLTPANMLPSLRDGTALFPSPFISIEYGLAQALAFGQLDLSVGSKRPPAFKTEQ